MNGAMCEYLSLPAKQLHRLPDTLSYEEGTMLDPVGNALHVFNRSHVKIGNCVAVVGCGTIGLVAIQVAKLAGAGRVMENRKITVKPLITHTFPLNNVQEAFETVGRDDSTKVIVTM